VNNITVTFKKLHSCECKIWESINGVLNLLGFLPTNLCRSHVCLPWLRHFQISWIKSRKVFYRDKLSVTLRCGPYYDIKILHRDSYLLFLLVCAIFYSVTFLTWCLPLTMVGRTCKEIWMLRYLVQPLLCSNKLLLNWDFIIIFCIKLILLKYFRARNKRGQYIWVRHELLVTMR
jgi:hypothetical protein